jgi:catechol O-methyltransferase
MIRLPLLLFLALAFSALLLQLSAASALLPGWLWWTLTALPGALALHELVGHPIPYLRWSFLRMLLARKRLRRHWQVGDGREEAAARYVLATASKGDAGAAIHAIDEYAYRHKFLINVGDRKGAILEQAVERVKPRLVLEFGAYVGYSALRIARTLPEHGRLISIEKNPANAEIARRIAAHAGVVERVAFVVGDLGDDGKTAALLRDEHDVQPGSLDLVFIDHAKDAYVPDLQRILAAGWLHTGSVVIADNVGFPGAPEYRAYMEAAEGKRFQTRVHETSVEYQSLLRDLVLESTMLR